MEYAPDKLKDIIEDMEDLEEVIFGFNYKTKKAENALSFLLIKLDLSLIHI